MSNHNTFYDIEVKRGPSGQWYANIIAPNGEIVYTQEVVYNRQDAIDTAVHLRDNGQLKCRVWVFDNGARTLVP